MAKEWAKSFYGSKEWQRTRNAYYQSQFGICEICEGAGYIVHHMTELTPANIHDPNISLAWDNLQLVCQTCHNNIHMSSEATEEGLMFNSDGELVLVGNDDHI